jgi:hypothetical protein
VGVLAVARVTRPQRYATNRAAGHSTRAADGSKLSRRQSLEPPGPIPIPRPEPPPAPQNDPFSNGDVGDRNGLIDSAARDIAKVLRKHVGKKALEQIVAESLELRGDKDS